jgi:hypothetical protein
MPVRQCCSVSWPRSRRRPPEKARQCYTCAEVYLDAEHRPNGHHPPSLDIRSSPARTADFLTPPPPLPVFTTTTARPERFRTLLVHSLAFARPPWISVLFRVFHFCPRAVSSAPSLSRPANRPSRLCWKQCSRPKKRSARLLSLARVPVLKGFSPANPRQQS